METTTLRLPGSPPSTQWTTECARVGEFGLVVAQLDGPGEIDSVVVVLPGWKGTDLGLRAVLEPLATAGRRIVVVNLPGAGISESGGPATLSQFKAWTLAVMARYRGVRLVLVGHSFGASIVSAIAAESPEGLSGAVLLSPTRIASGRLGVAARIRRASIAFYAHLLRSLPSTLARGVLLSPWVGDVTNSLLARRGFAGIRRIRNASRADRHLAPDPVALASHLDLSLVCDYAADLAHSPIPAIVIAGDRDPATGGYGSEVPDLQHVRRFTIPGAGHLAHHEDADQVRRLLATAIEALLDRARG